MNCIICNRDINLINQDNVSPFCGHPICEDCANELTEKEWNELQKDIEDEEDERNYDFNSEAAHRQHFRRD